MHHYNTQQMSLLCTVDVAFIESVTSFILTSKLKIHLKIHRDQHAPIQHVTEGSGR